MTESMIDREADTSGFSPDGWPVSALMMTACFIVTLPPPAKLPDLPAMFSVPALTMGIIIHSPAYDDMTPSKRTHARTHARTYARTHARMHTGSM
jgi:hypothetical protein